MVLSAAALTLLLNCARPLENHAQPVGVQTMAGLIEHESGWTQLAIGDNTARVAYCVPGGRSYPCTYQQAVAIATTLRQEGHSIDAGFAQINSANWPGYGINAASVFNACTNLHVGADILTRAYRGALAYFPSGDDALTHALSEYNSGDFYASLGYSHAVIGQARGVVIFRTIPAPLGPVASVPSHVEGLPVRSTTASVHTALPALTVNHADGGPTF